MVDMLKMALGYQQHGFAVYPLAPGTRTPLKGSHGYKDATKDPKQAEACKNNPCDEVAFAIIARGTVDRVEIWKTLLSQLTDQLNDADTNLQIAVDNLYHKGGE